VFVIKQNDTERTLTEALTDAGVAVDLTGASVSFDVRDAGGNVTTRAATVNDPQTAGVVSYRLVTADVASAGNFWYEWRVTFADGGQRSFPELGPGGLRIISMLGTSF
jgi:hypothetical protein